MALTDDLLPILKNKLQVTWTDTGTDAELTRMLISGQAYLNTLTGATLTFSDGSPEQELLLERCRYEWNNALDEFETNYQGNLLRLIMAQAVADDEAESTTTTTTTTTGGGT